MDTPSRDGREALRKLDAEYRPPTHRGRQMALAEAHHAPEVEQCWFRRRVHQQTVRVEAGAARVRADFWQRAESDREDCNTDVGSATSDAGTIFGHAQKKLAPTTRK